MSIRTTVITGFAGSLGTAFTNYCLARGDLVIGIDNSEWSVASFPEHQGLTKSLGDIDSISGEYDLLIHCAAYKHVDLIEQEQNRMAAFHNNVVKTQLLFENVKAPILFISTDKSVEPASFYGETKKQGEDITKQHGGVIARLGNIKLSTGSVIPKWEAAVANGEPLPITDPKMTRFWIGVDEAVSKVMALLPHAKAGQVIVPWMGKSISLGDMVERLYPNYPTKIIGIRPGEKMHEKLYWSDEKRVYFDDNGEVFE